MNTCLILLIKNGSSDTIDFLDINKKEFNMLFIIDINSDIELMRNWCSNNNISLTIHKSDKIISGNDCIKLARTLCKNVDKFKIID